MANLSLAQAKQLCTASEIELVEASRTPRIERWNAAQLKSKMGRARKLRDKWRDMYAAQRRKAQQQGTRGDKEADRSQQKAALFGEVLQALEAQRKVAPTATGGSTKRAPAKAKRSQGHRLIRAATRKELEAKRMTKEMDKARVVKPAGGQSPSQPTPKPPKKRTVAASKKKTAIGKKVAKQAAMQAVPRDADLKPARKIGPIAAAKQNRVKISGLTTRTRGHVSARGKRNQARRDQRG